MAKSKSGWIIDVEEANFMAEVVERSREVPVVVDFTAVWCKPCQFLGPTLEKLAREQEGRFILAKVDFDRNQYLASQMGVQSIPAVFGFVDGKIASYFVGALPEEQVREFLKQVLPTKAGEMLKRAHELAESQPAAALRLLDEVRQEQPENEDTAALRARVLVRLGRDDEARRWAEQVTEGSDYYQEAANVLAQLCFREQARELGGVETCRARLAKKDKQAHYDHGICLAAEGRYKEALDELLAAGQADPSLASSKVKDAMVQIFHLLGPGNELADDYRSRLATLLY